MESSKRSINIVAAALGGQGGGVFTNWLIDVAEANGWRVQTTSLAGVAQRTGATIYYIELIPRREDGQEPVLSLFPSQGDIDIAICSEVAEAGRMLQRGFVTPERTTLITSTNRVFSINEKSDLADGSIDPQAVLDIAQRYARQLVAYDMQQLADANQSVISSVLLGALAGSAALPFSQDSFESAIRQSGKAVDNSLAAFHAGKEQAQRCLDDGGSVFVFEPPAVKETARQALAAVDDRVRMQVQQQFPAAVHELVLHGVAKTTDYQDEDYAALYLEKLKPLIERDDGSNEYELSALCARYLALWMCFEDIPRVAQLKLREHRMAEIRSEVGIDEQQIAYVTEFFKPRAEEMCAMLPAGLGEKLLGNSVARRVLDLFSGGRKLRTNTIGVHLALRGLARMRRLRRASLGYRHEHSMIDQWLNAVHTAAGHSNTLACELAKCGRLVKGYGDTRQRTSQQNQQIVALYQNEQTTDAARIRRLREAALADDSNEQFNQVLTN